MLCASLLVPGPPLLTTTETGHSAGLALAPMLYVCSCVQRLSAGSKVEVRSCYLLICISAGTLAVIGSVNPSQLCAGSPAHFQAPQMWSPSRQGTYQCSAALKVASAAETHAQRVMASGNLGKNSTV